MPEVMDKIRALIAPAIEEAVNELCGNGELHKLLLQHETNMLDAMLVLDEGDTGLEVLIGLHGGAEAIALPVDLSDLIHQSYNDVPVPCRGHHDDLCKQLEMFSKWVDHLTRERDSIKAELARDKWKQELK